MKKFFALIVGLFTFCSITQVHGQASFDKGDKAINLGIGLFSLGANASAEFGIQKNLGIGPYFSYERPSTGIIGALVGVRYNYNYLNLGVRATYHFNELLKLNSDKFDLYGAGGLGLYSYSYPSEYYRAAGLKSSYIGPQFHLRIGTRVFLSEKMAGWAEIGSGGSWLQGGIAFKL